MCGASPHVKAGASSKRGCVIQYSTGAGGAASVVNHFPRGPVPWVASADNREIPSRVSP